MICHSCFFSFFNNPLNVVVIAVSLSVALVSLFLMVRKSSPKAKVFLVYVHVFGLVFPFVFYAFLSGCNAVFSGCSSLLPFVYISGLALLLSAVIGSFVTPLLFIYRNSRTQLKVGDGFVVGFVRAESLRLGIRPPKVCIIDSAKPLAFSFSNVRPVVFVSIGLLDLLSRKEVEAVLLHELMHVRQGSSIFRFSAFFLRLFSPLSAFASFRHEFSFDERSADDFACRRQGTDRHVRSAKFKLNSFFEFQR